MIPDVLSSSPMAPTRYRVATRTDETYDTVTLALEPVDAPIAGWMPGQFNMLWAFGIGEVPISINNEAAPDERIGHTIRAVGAVTRALCATPVGDVVGVRGPFGVGWELDRAVGKDVVIIGGGIGLAPLRGVVTRALATRDRFGAVSVLVGARGPEDLLFRGELETWRSRLDTEVAVTVDHATPAWHGRVGLVTKLVERATFDPANTVAMICGPEVMLRFVAQGLIDRGVNPDSILVSMERNMQCAVGHCGHCQLAGSFVCKDGPVFSYTRVEPWIRVPEL